MIKDNRECIICKTPYYYCGRGCNNSNVAEQWRNIYCSETCREIFNICTSKQLSEEEAYNKLSKLTLPSRFTDGIQKEVDKIMKYKKKTEIQTVSEPKTESSTTPKKRGRRRKIVNEDN